MLAAPTVTKRAAWAGHLRGPAGPAAGAGPFSAALQPRRGGVAQHRDADGAAGQPGAQADDAAQVGQGGGDDVDPGVGVVDPVHRHLVDAQPGPLGQHQQLGVEEPAGVGGQRQQLPGRAGADGLEAALGVGEPGAERGVQEQVVAAGDDLAARAADHPRAARQPGADGHVRMARQQRRQQREQGVQVGRQVHVHVGADVGVAGRPDRPQRPAPPGPLQPHRPDPGQLTSQRLRLLPGAVGTAVVGDRDAGGEGKRLYAGRRRDAGHSEPGRAPRYGPGSRSPPGPGAVLVAPVGGQARLRGAGSRSMSCAQDWRSSCRRSGR